MKQKDHSALMAQLAKEYARRAPRSAELNQSAGQHMIDGGSHTLRLIHPFPPRIVTARGAFVRDEDGHDILDFWQGHHANILGHNPEVVTSVLAQALQEGWGLQTGFTDRVQVETAEILCRQTGAERVRFTTSGTLATMYAIMLARAFTGREWVLKIGGGWHGAQPWALKGVHFEAGENPWTVESEGVPAPVTEQVLTTRFNDPQALRDRFREHGNRLACFILEPFLGSGGFILAEPEYLRTARELADRYGVVLIFDEVISGFRFRAGDLGRLLGVQPDLVTLAKIIGGGMPVAAVAGKAEIMRLAGREGGRRVAFSGGTFSAHPLSMLAARTMLAYLVEHEGEIYPRLAALGARMRQTMEEAFQAEGILVRCTGGGNEAAPGSAFAEAQFLYHDGGLLRSPEQISDPEVADPVLRETVLQLALLVDDVHVVHGGGSVSMAHNEADIARLKEACARVAVRLKGSL